MVNCRSFQHNTIFIFVWLKIKDFISHQRPRPLRSAKYAVVFYTSTPSAALRPLALAYVLLRFVDENIRNADYHRFNLIAVTYRFVAHGILGVMFFDSSFRFAYSHAVSSSILSSDGFTTMENTHFPLLHWFQSPQQIFQGPSFVTPPFILRLLTAARYVF